MDYEIYEESDETSSSDSTDYTDSSEDDASNNYVLYRDRPEWNDVQPIVQEDGEANLDYSEKFSDVFDYVRGVLVTGEKSERTLELVTTALKLNPANNAIWAYRFDIVKSLKIDLHDELEYISNMIRKFSTNNQVWQYRQRLVEVLNDPSAELLFTADILEMDDNNFNAWQYRIWILRKFSHLMETELVFVDKLISQDIKNISAWNHRFLVVILSKYNSDQMEKEFQYTFDKILISTNNESSWDHLKGLVLFNRAWTKKVHDFCNELYGKGDRSVPLMSCLVDLLKYNDNCADPENFKFATKLCFDLAYFYDTFLDSYWIRIAKQITKKYSIVNEEDKEMDIIDEKDKEIDILDEKDKQIDILDEKDI